MNDEGVFDGWGEWRQPNPPPERPTNGHHPTPRTTNGTTPYGRKALEAELGKLAAATEGTRNQTLNDTAFALAQLVNAGHIAATDAEHALTTTATQIGLTSREITATIRSAGEGAGRKPRLDTPDPTAPPPTPTPTVLRVDDTKDLWEARPVLTHIRDFARARLVSPWAVLGITLARTAAQIPPFVVLPPLIGGHASLNLFIGVVGRSGAGKGGAEAAAADAFNWSETVETITIGSGEAIAHAYMERRKNTDTGLLEVHQHTTRAVFSIAEIDTLAALNNRTASTTMPELRKAWMGERLGFHYVDPQKRLPVPAHQYRLCLVAGIQPGRAGVLLDDTDGGTPQRFIWVPANDPDAPENEPNEPERRDWALPQWPWAGTHGVVLNVCQIARDTIKQARRERLRGVADALDGHALLARLKIAAALALLDQRAEVTDDDWDLAGTIMAVSDAVRAGVVADLAATNSRANKAKGMAEAERAIMVDDSRHEAAVKRVMRAILRRLDTAGDDGETAGYLRRSLASRDRSLFAEAVDRLIETGLIDVDESASEVRYRRKR